MNDNELIEEIYRLDKNSEEDLSWIKNSNTIAQTIRQKNFTNKSLLKSVILSLENESFKDFLVTTTGLF